MLTASNDRPARYLTGPLSTPPRPASAHGPPLENRVHIFRADLPLRLRVLDCVYQLVFAHLASPADLQLLGLVVELIARALI